MGLNLDPPDLLTVTETFRPNVAFKLMVPASRKRLFAEFHRRRNYFQRQGKHIKFFGGTSLNSEFAALHNEIRVLRDRVRVLADFRSELIPVFEKRPVAATPNSVSRAVEPADVPGGLR